MSQVPNRISGLDSLRGIAALIVLFCHYRLVILEGFFDSAFFGLSPFHWSIDGHIAVILFFILSGFVLAMPFQGNAQFSYKKFLIRRFCRIYLPFLVSILLAALLWNIFASGHSLSFAWNGWGRNLTTLDFFSHLFATGMTGSDYLNPPIWTLVQEMRVAIIFPLLVYLVRKAEGGAVIIAMLVGFLSGRGYAAIEPGNDMYFAKTLTGTALLTIYYIQFFVMGIYLALDRERWMAWMDKVPAGFFAGLGLLLFIVPDTIFHLPFTVHEMYYTGIGVFLITTCVKFEWFQNFLSFAPFRWLGKVSYSLYLTHAVIMMAMLYGLHAYFSSAIILLLAFPLILLVAHLMQKYVEAPSHELGKKLTP